MMTDYWKELYDLQWDTTSPKRQQDSSIYHIIYNENGKNKELWVDGFSGFIYRHRPVLRKRGFVKLLNTIRLRLWEVQPLLLINDVV